MNILGQNSLDDLNIIFQHDFENNTLGNYIKDEWKKDFNNPLWNERQSETDIVRNTSDPVNPTKTLQLNFPAKSLGSEEGGAYWWTPVEPKEEIYFSYDLYFMPGFQYQIGGKLPSMQGGELSDAGGSTGYDGFTGGLMFKQDGKIVSYMYFPDAKEPKYGESFTWGADYKEGVFAPSSVVIEHTDGNIIYCKPGEWHNITYRMVLNTIKPSGGGNYDGIIEGFFDGKLVFQMSHILYRHIAELKIDNLRIISFFGGGTDEWRNPIEEWIRIDNLLLYSFKDGMNVPYGNVLSSPNRTINYWRKFKDQTTDPGTIVPSNNVPVINNQQFSVEESSFTNNLIGKVIASDADAGQSLKYSITSGNSSGRYSINSQTGELTTTTANVFVAGATVSNELTVQVTDNAAEPKSASAKITVILISNSPFVGVNNPPTISNQQFTIQESSYSNNLIGRVLANDIDLGQALSYSIVSGNESAIFSLNSQTGDLLTLTDKIFAPGTISYALKVKVTDNGQEPKSSTATIKVNIIGTSKTVYIDPTNSKDVIKNGSIEHPFNSWKDVVWQEGFTYLQNRGTTAQVEKILISANNVSLGAYGEGELPVIISETNTYMICGFERSEVKIENLNLQAPNAVSSVYFLGNAGGNIIVEHCLLNANVNAIKVANGNTLIVRYNTISSNSEGVYSSAANNQLYYNIFKNCMNAINIMGNNANAKICNNVFFNNEKSLSVTYADLTLYNNIFYMTLPGQQAINLGNGIIKSNNNIYYPEQAGFITIANMVFNNLQELQQTMRIDMNSFISDPAFMDMYNENFAVSENSPAINSGVDLYLGTDLLGNIVPLSGTTDIGVYEFTGIISTPENQEQPSLMLYPNPSTGNVNIMAELDQQQGTDKNLGNKNEIRVVDLSGKTIFSKQIEQTSSTVQDNIDLSGISNGLYFVVLQYADKQIKEKLIISK